jgi:hypothetical protein
MILAMWKNPRIIHLWLLVATLVGVFVGTLLVLVFPPNDLAAAHAAATTPFARAVTSHAVDVAIALIACVMIAWILTLGGFVVLWPASSRKKIVLLQELFPMCVLLFYGTLGVQKIHALPTYGVFGWTLFSFSVLAALLGLVLCTSNLARISKPWVIETEK